MVTGKNREQFENWYFDNDMNASRCSMDLLSFYGLPFEMQIGVYLAYYDSLGVVIYMDYSATRKVFYTIGIEINKSGTHENYNVIINGVCDSRYFDSRNEAYKEAFKKADELINLSN